MRIILTIKADALKLAQLLSKFSKDYRITYTITKQNGEFLMEVNTDDFGELIRRLNHLKEATFQIKEMHGGRLLDKLNVKLTKTNIDALMDKTSIAKTDIDPIDGGVIKLLGELWFCRPAEDKIIKEGLKVRVVGVEGVSLIVEEVNK
ncbi:MAG: NfeD family protein [Candidatus Bathyarchaeota archaeon]|jgi:membrane-bound ClpP family serine protease